MHIDLGALSGHCPCRAGMIKVNVGQEYIVNVGWVDVLLLQSLEKQSCCGRGACIDDGGTPVLNDQVDGVKLRPHVISIDCGDAVSKLSVARRIQPLSATLVTPFCEKLNVCIAPLLKFVRKTLTGKKQ